MPDGVKEVVAPTFLEITGAVTLALAIWGIVDAFVFEPLATKMGPH
jgi:hypothetical protein